MPQNIQLEIIVIPLERDLLAQQSNSQVVSLCHVRKVCDLCKVKWILKIILKNTLNLINTIF